MTRFGRLDAQMCQRAKSYVAINKAKQKRYLSKTQRRGLLSSQQIEEARALDDDTLLALHDLLHETMEERHR